MGYSYECRSGKLCCDSCGKSGGVRKCACPFGWCQPIALCPECRRSHPDYLAAATHRERGCERQALEQRDREEQRKQLLADGAAVRCSALRCGEGRVHVLFAVKDGPNVGWYMDLTTYHAIDLLTNATPDDYARHGMIEPAPEKFDYGRATA